MTNRQSAIIECGGTRAVVDRLGATLTELRFGHSSVLAGPGRVAPAMGHHGAVLAPWPNRLAHGNYEFQGRTHQLPINDPAYGHALHGLAFDQEWRFGQQTRSSISLSHTVGMVEGYPFRVRITVTYKVSHSGLHCEAAWHNLGSHAAPFGIGFHPYFRPGPSPLSEWTLQVAAPRYQGTDLRTALPSGMRSVDHTDFDFRVKRLLGPHRFSVAFPVNCTPLPAEIVLADPAGRTLRIRMSDRFRWVQVFSGDLPNDLHRTGVAIEPQTCPANAFVTGEDLILIQPGERGSAAWSVETEVSRNGARGD